MSEAKAKRTCAICGKPPSPRYRPFCSKRCADIDLGRWLGEDYRIESVTPADGGFDEDLDGDDDGGGPPPLSRLH